MATTDWTIGLVNAAALAFGSTTQVRDCVMEKELNIGFAEPILGNVIGGIAVDPVNFNTAVFPGGAFEQVTEIPGPFIVGPQQMLLVTTWLPALDIRAYFRGRYYPSL